MTDNKSPNTIRSWIEGAEYDMETARAMLDTGRLLYVGFMCHQCIEKALKACFVKEIGTTPPYTHNLIQLARQSSIYPQFSEQQRILIAELNPLNIETRYPDDRRVFEGKMTKGECRKILEATEDLSTWLIKRLSK